MAARDRLAAELKEAGKTDAAAEVKKLRRPSVVAWAVNVTSRERPEDVQALREAGRALRRAQRKALSGGGGEDLREATDARRALVQTLADAGVAAIGERGAAHRDAIAATFDAASVDDELGERLEAGTLEREARPTAGFGAIEGFEVLQGGGAEDDEEPLDEDPAEARRERAREARARRAASRRRRARRGQGSPSRGGAQGEGGRSGDRGARGRGRREASRGRSEDRAQARRPGRESRRVEHPVIQPAR